jgi:hypothetical protein
MGLFCSAIEPNGLPHRQAAGELAATSGMMTGGSEA